MSHRLGRIALSTLVGAVAVAIGLYFGRFVAAAAALPFASSRQAIPLATGTTWWAFTGLIAGVGFALTAVSAHRIRVALVSILGFGLGGALAAVFTIASGADRAPALTTLGAPLGGPLGGALAGLLVGLAAGLGIRAVALLIVGAAAMLIAAPQIGPALPAPDVIALLAPGALIGAALAILAGSDQPV